MSFHEERALAIIAFALGAGLDELITVEVGSFEQLEYLVVSACFHTGNDLDGVTRKGQQIHVDLGGGMRCRFRYDFINA